MDVGAQGTALEGYVRSEKCPILLLRPSLSHTLTADECCRPRGHSQNALLGQQIPSSRYRGLRSKKCVVENLLWDTDVAWLTAWRIVGRCESTELVTCCLRLKLRPSSVMECRATVRSILAVCLLFLSRLYVKPFVFLIF